MLVSEFVTSFENCNSRHVERIKKRNSFSFISAKEWMIEESNMSAVRGEGVVSNSHFHCYHEVMESF